MLSFSFMPKPGKKPWPGRGKSEDDAIKGVFEGSVFMAFRKERSKRLPGAGPGASAIFFLVSRKINKSKVPRKI